MALTRFADRCPRSWLKIRYPVTGIARDPAIAQDHWEPSPMIVRPSVLMSGIVRTSRCSR